MDAAARVRAQEVLERCRALGFAAAGVCAAEPSGYSDQFRAWVSRGEHGTMAYMDKHADVRLDVRLLLDGAQSVVMVADQYGLRGDVADERRPGVGRVARYARGEDYHKVIKRRLHALCDELAAEHAGERFRVFVDTAPVLERELAARCGIGWQGKHTLTINPVLGSYLLLGGFVTTMKLEAPPEQEASKDHCGTCTRCIDACPTQAIRPYSVNATRCISYLTIEHRGEIEPEFRQAMGDWIFGCDVCQEVCPHNSARDEQRGRVHPTYAPRRVGFDLLEVLNWSEDDRRAAFKGSALKRAKLEMMKRNAAIAAGNVGGEAAHNGADQQAE
ncbi:MAG: tRNA epoxyqueuosine(34) reductase QueG [Phycisphaerales bacterium]|nr:tRNA epoxyqueuosine(34) reductase QueG [Phycisphaerales bacterium]